MDLMDGVAPYPQRYFRLSTEIKTNPGASIVDAMDTMVFNFQANFFIRWSTNTNNEYYSISWD